MDYVELAFYKQAREVVKLVNVEINKWSKTMQAQSISRQLFRAATSKGSNIAEVHGRHSGAEYIHFLLIAQGSANEVDHWLHTASECSLSNPQSLQNIIKMNNETRKMLNATIKTLKTKIGIRMLHETTLPYPTNPSSDTPYSPIPYPLDDNDNL